MVWSLANISSLEISTWAGHFCRYLCTLGDYNLVETISKLLMQKRQSFCWPKYLLLTVVFVRIQPCDYIGGPSLMQKLITVTMNGAKGIGEAGGTCKVLDPHGPSPCNHRLESEVSSPFLFPYDGCPHSLASFPEAAAYFLMGGCVLCEPHSSLYQKKYPKSPLAGQIREFHLVGHNSSVGEVGKGSCSLEQHCSVKIYQRPHMLFKIF